MELANQFAWDKIINLWRMSMSSVRHGNVPHVQDPILPEGCELNLESTTCLQVQQLIQKCPPKTCCADPIPTALLKCCLPEISPIIGSIVNSSIIFGVF